MTHSYFLNVLMIQCYLDIKLKMTQVHDCETVPTEQNKLIYNLFIAAFFYDERT